MFNLKKWAHLNTYKLLYVLVVPIVHTNVGLRTCTCSTHTQTGYYTAQLRVHAHTSRSQVCCQLNGMHVSNLCSWTYITSFTHSHTHTHMYISHSCHGSCALTPLYTHSGEREGERERERERERAVRIIWCTVIVSLMQLHAHTHTHTHTTDIPLHTSEITKFTHTDTHTTLAGLVWHILLH